MTEQRRLIHSIICESDRHPTAEMIYQIAKSRMPSIAIGTVYRNLKLMVAAGEIRHIAVYGQPDRYDKTIANHDHFFCVDCGRVIDCNIEDLTGYITDRTGIEVLSYELNAYYRCDECLLRASGKMADDVECKPAKQN